MRILYFFLFLRVIFALLDPDPATQINADPDQDADPDPQPWFKRQKCTLIKNIEDKSRAFIAIY